MSSVECLNITVGLCLVSHPYYQKHKLLTSLQGAAALKSKTKKPQGLEKKKKSKQHGKDSWELLDVMWELRGEQVHTNTIRRD